MKDPSAHVVLPEIISKEPLAPLVKHGDNQWKDLVTWVINGLINAEELGVNQSNVSNLDASLQKNPTVQRMLGMSGEYGSYIGLENDWMKKAITAVGNYGEIFDRNLGKGSPLNLSRDNNALWTNGGLMYVAPLR